LNTVIFVIIIILFLVVMIGIINTFRMIMYERIREIGTMRAIGMQKGGVALIFILESFFLTLFSCTGGMILAILVGLGFSLKNYGTNNPMFFLLKSGHMSFIYNPLDILLYLGAIAVLTFLAVLYPALKAANLKPADALGKIY
jgi:putative ABC transport system permease protein